MLDRTSVQQDDVAIVGSFSIQVTRIQRSSLSKDMNMKRRLILAMVPCLTLTSMVATAGSPVSLKRTTPYVEGNDIPDKIKNECSINTDLPLFIAEYAEKNGIDVVLADEAVSTAGQRYLSLEIVDAVSLGNAWMGHQKYTSVRGSLHDGEAVVASFKARRMSMGGMFAQYKGSCSVLERTVKAIGKDVSAWLMRPEDGAQLGD